MQINKFKIFTIDRILIYLGLCFAFPLACCAQAIRYNYFEHSSKIPLPGWLAMAGAMFGFTLGVFRLFWDRYVFKKQITGYTTDGIAVFMPTYKNALPAFDDMCTQLEAATKEVVDFWEVRYPNAGPAMENLINGSMLGFTSQTINLLAHPTFPTVNLPSTFKQFAVAITSGNSMLVMAQPAETIDVVIRRVKHELGHVCLTSANVPQDQQHPVMAQYGFPY